VTSLPTLALPIEAFDWIDTTKLSNVVANFARAQILVALFDGDPDKWIEFLRRDGTPQELEHDLPFALTVKRRMDSDADYINRLRSLVREFSRLV